MANRQQDRPTRIDTLRGDSADMTWAANRRRNQARPPILEVLPAELRRDALPGRCLCDRCAASMSEAQRAAHERVERDWRYTRIAWCEAHGYPYVELIRAEMPSSSARRADAG